MIKTQINTSNNQNQKSKETSLGLLTLSLKNSRDGGDVWWF